MSTFAFDKKNNLLAYGVDLDRGGRKLKSLALRLAQKPDSGDWPPERFNDEFAMLCGANNRFDALTQAKRTTLDIQHLDPRQRQAEEKQTQRREYIEGKTGWIDKGEPEAFMALFGPDFVQRFPYRWRRMAFDQFDPVSRFWHLPAAPAIGLDMLVGEGAEEMVRAVIADRAEYGLLVDFRDSGAWDQLTAFEQRDFGMIATTVGVIGMRDVLKRDAVAFIDKLAAFARQNGRWQLVLAAHRKDAHFFLKPHAGSSHFDAVTVNDLDKLIDHLQWWTSHRVGDSTAPAR